MKGKTVVITGAGRGLGAALCRKFGEAGAFIAGCDLSVENLDNLGKELDKAGIPHFLKLCDVSDENSVNAFFTDLTAKDHRPDILINNAGITNINLFRDVTTPDVRKVMDINFMGCVHTTRAAYEDIVARKGGFIAISSVAGFAPLIGRTAYAASKHAVLGFFETLRTELSSRGVHVLVVCPGFIDTELRSHVYKAGEDNTTTSHKVGKNATPDEVANLIFQAYQKKKPMLVTGIGRISYWLKRVSPGLYEKLMTNKLKGGFDFNEHPLVSKVN